jgi:hypothetical protein
VRLFSLLAVSTLIGTSSLPLRADVTLEEKQDRIRVEIDGKLFTEYRFSGAPHVYFYPLLGPSGERMTRAWPMEDLPGEEHDHPHHRSLWFAHGSVNSIDFWAEPTSFGNKPPQHPLGQIVHRKFLELRGGVKEGVISSLNHWVGPEGEMLESIQTLRVYDGADQERLFDFEITLKPTGKEVVFGDTKEGTMALRINESMRIQQPRKQPGDGHAVNAHNQRDSEVWGKRSPWVDYSGPVDGKVMGIAIFEHPKNPRHPTRWHAREYGLFAANPFCEHEMDKALPAGSGSFKIPAGQSVTFRYRFLVHSGDAASAQIAQRYAEYAAGAR